MSIRILDFELKDENRFAREETPKWTAQATVRMLGGDLTIKFPFPDEVAEQLSDSIKSTDGIFKRLPWAFHRKDSSAS